VSSVTRLKQRELGKTSVILVHAVRPFSAAALPLRIAPHRVLTPCGANTGFATLDQKVKLVIVTIDFGHTVPSLRFLEGLVTVQ